jgi:threonylcarbamoyladenosine tRNA methylthiotransferase MtaB
MPHLHLSLQAGDDMILKRMKRRHLRQHAIDFCAHVRTLRPDIVFGADLIAGFPTETQEMFENSLALIDECGLTHVHVFPFSPRQGTPASKMPPVHGTIIKQRAAQLRDKAQAAYSRHLDRLKDQTLEVLTERGGIARARDFTPIHIDHPAGQLGQVRITHRDEQKLYGCWLAPIS